MIHIKPFLRACGTSLSQGFKMGFVTLLIALGVGSLLCCASAPAQPVEQPEMGVGDVIRLVQAGLSDDLVIAAIQKNGTRFDLGTTELIELKKAGVSDAVIKVMIQQGAKAPAPVSSGPASQSSSSSKSYDRSIDEIEFYLVEAGKPVQIPARTFSTQKLGGLNLSKMAATAGIAKAKQKAVLRNPRATVRTKNAKPEFLFYAPEGFSPADYLLLRFQKKGGQREAVVGRMGITGTSVGFHGKELFAFSSKKLATRRYLISFGVGREPGEYCFYPAGGLRVAGDAVDASGRLYDFGIEAFSNPRMILKWGWSGKGPALGVDLLSEGVRGGGKRSRVWP